MEAEPGRRVCHYLPGTSKWTKIEHRLFCHTQRWRGRPLETLETGSTCIGATTTTAGLKIRAGLPLRQGHPRSDETFAALNLETERVHGQGNYRISPKGSD